MGVYDGGRFATHIAITLKGSSHMTLLSSLLHRLENPKSSRDQQAGLRCQLARAFEDQGEYEAARLAMGDFWRLIGEPPNTKGLEPRVAGEVFLRAGVLAGLIGNKHQIANAQEIAKDLLGKGISIFEAQGNKRKVAEARTELSLCYWREGAYDEARVVLDSVLGELKANDELKAKALLRLAIVERSAREHNKALQILIKSAPLFEKITNNTIKGSYHNNLANLWENLGNSESREDYTDRAFIEYAAASYHFEQAEHKCYRGKVENNLGFLYFKAGNFTEAHEHLDRARLLLSSIKDNDSVAQVDETRARVFLAQGNDLEAERTVRASVMIFEQSGRHDLLTEALIVHGIALARLGCYSQSYATLQDAIEAAQQAGAPNRAGEAALILIEELGEHLTPRTAKTSATNALVEEVHRYEHDLIMQALIKAEGSVTRAARLLGTTHQRLIYIIKYRHKDLRSVRRPVIHRRKSIYRSK